VTDDVQGRLAAALSDRYSIQREIGAGGMATVYLAEDLKHHRKVALKVLRPELAAALGAERFLQEIEIAAQLHHPHILPLYDSGDADGFLYYVMPYEEGQSLREKLAREGELPITEAVRILRDVVDALTHAHKHNVVHRDIKPDNVMLADRHALVTDFGVAKAVSEATGRHNLTTEGIALGTPAYMAPEQAAADPHIDHRADIYAVGAVAYELLTGRPPFMGTTPQEILAAHVTQAVEPVTKYRDAVPPSLAELVMRCLKKKPADRWQNAEELLPQLEGLATPSGGMTPTETMPVDRVAKRRWMMAGGAVGVAAVIAVFVVMAALPRGSGARLNPDHVVVAAFRNATGDPALDLLGERVGHWITQGIQQTAIPVTPWDQSLQSWAYVQGEAKADRVRDPVRALAEETGAGVVVSGTVYVVEGDSLEVQVNVTDAVEGMLLGTVEPLRASRASESDLITDAQQRVMAFLAPRFDEFLQQFAPSDVMSAAPTFEAYQAFTEGSRLHMEASGRSAEAIEYFREAFAWDSTWATPLLRMWMGLSSLGRIAERDSAMIVLEELWDRLSPYERAEAQFFQAYGDFDIEEAVRHLHRAVELAPRSVSTYNLALNLNVLNRPREALDMLLTLDPERGWVRDWEPYWLQRTRALHMLGEHEQELEAAQRCRQRHAERARCLERQTFALAALGRVQEVAAVLDELEPMPGMSASPWFLTDIIDFLRHYGHADAAKDAAERAVRWFEARPQSETTTFEHRHEYGRALFFAGRYDDAQAVFDALVEELPDDDYMRAYNRAHRGFIAAMRGDTAQALSDADSLEMQAEALAGFSKDAARWWCRGIIYGALGDRERAMALFRQFEPRWTHSPWGHVQAILEPMRGYPPFEELLRPKG
jgi:tetratricopeptide (TPR) repeat protein/tRNA A-37 threonylcarbamoyl transferase component Bud32